MAKHHKIGQIGEEIATKHYAEQGFIIVERNYRLKYGEIDIIAKKQGILHFVEVKTVSYETIGLLKMSEKDTHDSFRAEEKVDARKQKRMSNAIKTWLSKHAFEGEWQVDVAIVKVVPERKYAVIEILENVVF